MLPPCLRRGTPPPSPRPTLSPAVASSCAGIRRPYRPPVQNRRLYEEGLQTLSGGGSVAASHPGDLFPTAAQEPGRPRGPLIRRCPQKGQTRPTASRTQSTRQSPCTPPTKRRSANFRRQASRSKRYIEQGAKVFDQVDEYAESSWHDIRGNGTEAQKAADQRPRPLAASHRPQRPHPRLPQDFEHAQALIAEANSQLDQARKLIAAIIDRLKNIQESQRTAQAEIATASRDIQAGQDFVQQVRPRHHPPPRRPPQSRRLAPQRSPGRGRQTQTRLDSRRRESPQRQRHRRQSPRRSPQPARSNRGPPPEAEHPPPASAGQREPRRQFRLRPSCRSLARCPPRHRRRHPPPARRHLHVRRPGKEQPGRRRPLQTLTTRQSQRSPSARRSPTRRTMTHSPSSAPWRTFAPTCALPSNRPSTASKKQQSSSATTTGKSVTPPCASSSKPATPCPPSRTARTPTP